MARIVSIHHYRLRPELDAGALRKAVASAEERGLFKLPGLYDHLFLEGVKGEARGQCAALWFYASRQAWEKLWGPPENPKPKSEYPDRWKLWEDEILTPILQGDPDQITFTSYREIGG